MELRVVTNVFFNELRRKTRDFSFLITAFVGPFIMATILGLAFGNTAKTGFVRVAIYVPNPNQTTLNIIDAGLKEIALPNAVKIHITSDFSQYKKFGAAVKKGSIDALLVVSPDFLNLNEQLQALPKTDNPLYIASIGLNKTIHYNDSLKSNPPIAVIGGDQLGIPIGNAISIAIESRIYTGLLTAVDISVASHQALAFAVDKYTFKAASSLPPLTIHNSSLNSAQDIIGYYGPSMAIVFLFIAAGLATRSIVQEHTIGTIARLVAAPVKTLPIVVGKMLAIMLSGIVSVFALWLETTLIFKASWGSSIGVIMLTVTTVLALGGLSIFMTSFAKDEQQAMTSAVGIGFLLGILSGNFFPPGNLPSIMLKLSLLVPNGWALVGFGRLSQEHLGWPSAIGPSFALTVIALIFGSLSLFRINKVMSM